MSSSWKVPVLFSGGSAASALLLDNVSNVTSAYGFRKLRTAYAGSALRVRRSSDSTEQDIGFSANEFDSAAFTTFVGGGSGFVTKWYDQVGSKDFVNATANAQPLVALSVLNGKPILRTDGTNDTLAPAVPQAYGTSATVLLVASKTSGTDDYLLASNTAGGDPAIISGFGGLSFEFYNVADRYTISAGGTGHHILGWSQSDATYLRTYYDSTTPVSNVVPAVAINGKSLLVIATLDGASNAAASDFAEMIVGAPALSTNDITSIISNQKSYYGL